MNCFNLLFKYRNSILVIILAFIGSLEAEVLDLTDTNFDQYISEYEVVFVNFHAEWCGFSKLLAPIMEQTEQIISQEFKEPNRILFAKVDCEQNQYISARYKIKKYPTIKVFINGKSTKIEFRGHRTPEAIGNFIRELLTDPVVPIVYKSYDDMYAVLYNKSAIIGYFRKTPETHPKYSIFRRVATELRGYCSFYWITGSPYTPEGEEGMLAFKSYRSSKQLEYDFMYETYDEFSSWSTQLCLPVVREITFENAEEIIEEGLPLVILFHNPDDDQSVDMFKKIVQDELISETANVNFVTADGNQFGHPLIHINKTMKDLPLIAIDSFEHMFLFPKFEDLNKTKILANFIEDLKSGKLHRVFHFGTDYDPDQNDEEDSTTSRGNFAVETEDNPNKIDENESVKHENVVDRDRPEHREEYEEHDLDADLDLTPVAESVFKYLGPSEHRYSFKDEL